jgi:integrase
MATKVKLRQKKISGNRFSLYLDYYPAIPHPETGNPTRREFLGLYLFEKPKSSEDKQHNEDTLKLARQIHSNRENEINKPEIYSGYEKERLRLKKLGERSFIEYFDQLAGKRKGTNHDNWNSAYKYLKAFTKGNLRFSDLNEKFCYEFRDHLLTSKSNKSKKVSLSQNSAVSYFNKFKASLKQAFKEGYLQTDLNSKIEPVKQAETRRNFLTIEELNKLANSDCPNPLLKRAALFSALTGMAFKEIQNLTWGNIEHSSDYGYFISYKRQKTQRNEVLPISPQAYNLLGERKNPNDRVFEGINDRDRYYYFTLWLASAGITKELTFHCMRHTYATLQLSMGTDIYTVSKMLGHKGVKTTQVYAKIIDQTKRTAADKIKLDM